MSSTRLRLSSLSFAAALAFCLCYLADHLLYAAPAYDQSWLLYAANRVLQGATLDGPRLTETNPPLIVWFSTLPDLLAHALHITPLAALHLFVAAVIIASAAWCTRILFRARLATTLPVCALCFLAIAAAETSLPDVAFAQREQLVLLFALPCLLYGASRAGHPFIAFQLPLTERLLLGFFAGFGVCLKPQEALILLAFELSLIALASPAPARPALGFRLRSLLRAEAFAAAATICLYIAVVYLATPYFRVTVPLLADTYWAFSEGARLPLLAATLVDPFLLAPILAWALLRRRLRTPAAPVALFAAAVGALLAYIQQGTDWPHHFFPCRALLLCSLGWILLDAFRSPLASLPRPRTVAVATLLFVTLALPLTGRHERRRLARDSHQLNFLTQTLAQYPPGTPIYMISTGLGAFTDVLDDRLLWSSRYAHLWLLPAILRNQAYLAGGPPPRRILPSARVQQLAALQRSVTVEDLQLYHPQLVVVDRCTSAYPCQALHGFPVDLLAWFLQSPAFVAQWSHYHRTSGNPQFDIYTRTP